MKHISIRVPWHDNNWNGQICKIPCQNTFCSQLPRIAENKKCCVDNTCAGLSFSTLSEDEMPACLNENGSFMNENPYKRTFRHVYSNYPNLPHSSLLPTVVDVPEYTYFGTPFRHMLYENLESTQKKYPDLPNEEMSPFSHNTWIYGRELQYGILRKFLQEIREKESLVVFYCKNGNPIDEECERLIVGLGEITNIYPIGEYESKIKSTYPFWDLKMSHSIRPELDESLGFLLPYKEYLQLDPDYVYSKLHKSKEDCIDEIKLTFAKLGGSQKIKEELSYGCEHVNNHTMLIILNTAKSCIEKVVEHGLVGGDWQRQIRWIDSQISKVKEKMGPFPSFAEVLSSLGYSYSFILEQDIYNLGYCAPKGNPWIIFEQILSGEIVLGNESFKDYLPEYKVLWKATSRKKKQLYYLLSRFELSVEQLEIVFNSSLTSDQILNNPYLISEICDVDIPDTIITPEMIDLGVFKDVSIQGEYIPEKPSLVETKIDERRIRALVSFKLKNSLNEGDTLLSLTELEEYLSDVLERDLVKYPSGYLMAMEEFMSESFVFHKLEGNLALQLSEIAEMEREVSKIFVARAAKSIRNPIDEDWNTIAKSVIKEYDDKDPRSVAAIVDQTRALGILSNKRLSVLTGAAGTGKTKVVEAFLKSDLIKNEGVLLLAPTGKARVRLQKMGDIQAMTIAQFLVMRKAFNVKSMKPQVTDDTIKYSGVRNVIIDECSMLTLYDFYALLNSLDLKVINRIILIGDPYQLPPIGPGRPFADLCNYLETARDKDITSALACLTNVVRTTTKGDSDILTLASWFSGRKPEKSADLIFDKMLNGQLDNDMNLYVWKNPDELIDKLSLVLNNELPNKSLSMSERIDKSLGLDDLGNAINNPDCVENFQILTPVRNPIWGTTSLNAEIQQMADRGQYGFIQIGPDKFYYKDKIIQLENVRLSPYEDKTKKCRLANGQIGFIKFASGHSYKKYGSAVFAGEPGYSFSINERKDEDSSYPMELAYAITIHKSQGSDFNTVIVVLPKSGRILSRELLYTALTRAKKRMILLVEDSPQWLLELSKPQNSSVASRNTNMFSNLSVRETQKSIPYIEGLIHRTLDNSLIVRSKSEVIIANQLINRKVKFEYERELVENNRKCIPDFTFEDPSGDIIIWEHLGMLDIPSYKRSWEHKYEFYKSIGFELDKNLFITQDHADGSINSLEIDEIIDKIQMIID